MSKEQHMSEKADKNEELKKAEDKFVEGVNNIALTWGMNSVEAKMIGYLLAQNQPTSLNDMVENLKISKGNISVSIRKLEEKGIVKNIWVKGDRKDYYEITLELWQIFSKKMLDNYRAEALNAMQTIDLTIPLVQAAFPKLGKNYKN
jgi:DNA-binding transcriptional regulator GbsR (MarR family)